MRALLDVNVLIALLDTDHIHHDRTRQWLVQHTGEGWATCPLTENGCIRIMSQPGYPNPLATSAVIERLSTATNDPSHQFWPADITLLDDTVADRARVHGPRQVTDVYLLALAVRYDGRFVTLDAAVPISAVRGAASRHLLVI